MSFILIKASGRVRAASEPQKWSYLSLDMGSFITSKLITEQSKLITKFLDQWSMVSWFVLNFDLVAYSNACQFS